MEKDAKFLLLKVFIHESNFDNLGIDFFNFSGILRIVFKKFWDWLKPIQNQILFYYQENIYRKAFLFNA